MLNKTQKIEQSDKKSKKEKNFDISELAYNLFMMQRELKKRKTEEPKLLLSLPTTMHHTICATVVV